MSNKGVRRKEAVCSRQFELGNGFILISACNNEQAGIEIAGGQRDREVIGILIGCYKEHLCVSNAGCAQYAVSACIPLKGEISLLHTVLYVRFILVNHHEWFACSSNFLSYLRTHPAIATYDVMLAQCSNLPIHNAPPNRSAHMTLHHILRCSPQRVEE